MDHFLACFYGCLRFLVAGTCFEQADHHSQTRLRDGRALCYSESGPADGAAVLFFHRGLECRLVCPTAASTRAARACRIISIDRIAATDGRMPAKANFVQYDGLFGPQAATIEVMKRRPGCTCEVRASSIETARRRRRSRQGA